MKIKSLFFARTTALVRLLTLFVLLALHLCGTTHVNAQIGLLADYPFNGNANDATGNGNNGTVYGATLTTDRFGFSNKAYNFSGTSDYIDIGTQPSLNPAFFTLSIWFKTNVAVAAGIMYRVHSYGHGIMMLNGNVRYWCYAGGSAPSDYLYSTTPGTYYDNCWHNAVLTYDGSNCKFYMDGALLNTISKISAGIYYLSGHSFISKDGIAGTGYFNGSLDDLQIYNRALNDYEIKALYAASTPLAISQANIACYGGNNGSATVTLGSTPYTYLWDNGQTTSSTTGLSAGTYTCAISDAAGCQITQTVTITEPTAITATITSNPATCNNNNGSATVIASGGTGTLTYSWSPAGGNNANAIALAGGNYTVLVTDANGCTETQTVTVAFSNGPNVSPASQTNVLCFGDNTGSAAVNVIGGMMPYTYSWNTLPVQNTSAANGLSAGNYMVTVTDDVGCISSQTVTITQPTLPLSISPNATQAGCNISTGTATANAAGGTGAFTYLWNNGQITQTATGLGEGSYSIMVTDSNGCSNTDNVNVTEILCPCPPNPKLSIPNAFSPNNDGENDALCLQGGLPAGQTGIEECIQELTIVIYDQWGGKFLKLTTLLLNGMEGIRAVH